METLGYPAVTMFSIILKFLKFLQATPGISTKMIRLVEHSLGNTIFSVEVNISIY